MSTAFNFMDENQVEQSVMWDTPGLTVVMDSLGLVPQLVPADAIGLYNDTVIAGHDTSYAAAAKQSDGVTAFNLAGIPINFYAKVNPSDTVLVFSKTLAGNPSDVLVPTPSNGIINVFVRAADYALVAVGTTIFLYIDVVDSGGNPVNIAKWTLTITN